MADTRRTVWVGLIVDDDENTHPSLMGVFLSESELTDEWDTFYSSLDPLIQTNTCCLVYTTPINGEIKDVLFEGVMKEADDQQ